METRTAEQMRWDAMTQAQRLRAVKHKKCYCGSGKKYFKCHGVRRRISK